MTIAQRIGQVSVNVETATRAGEFTTLAKHILANGGKISAAAAAAAHSSRENNLGPKLADIMKMAGGGHDLSRNTLATLQKAAAGAGTLSSFSDYSVIAQGFVNSLANFSAFDGMLSAMTPLPVGTGTVGAVSVGASAYSVGEGSAKQISRLTITNQQAVPTKAHALIVITDELARSPLVAASQLLQRELQMAVGIATDAKFIDVITSGVSTATSVGATAEAVLTDIAALLQQVTLGQGSRPFIITTSLVAKMWSTLGVTGTTGQRAFPEMGPMGGSICGIPVLVSDGLLAGTVMLVDASGIGAGSADLALFENREGALQMDSAPDSPPTASTNLVSLWQSNLVGLMVERWFVAVKLRSDAVALVNNSGSYQTGFSPP
jgi:HK97 family phage major capsid protein